MTNWIIGQPNSSNLASIPIIELPALDNAQLLEKEKDRRINRLPPHFAKKRIVHIQPSTNGKWSDIDESTKLWSLRIKSPGALSLNLAFSAFQLPSEANFYIHAQANSQTIGPLTSHDNELHNQYYSPALEGDEIILKLYIPSNQVANLALTISAINHDFIGLPLLLKSSECQIDISCTEATPFENIAQSVGLVGIDGVGICTGFLINNTALDCRPYFMTAHHCDITDQNAPSVVVYWNYQNSFCRTADEEGDGSLMIYNSGSNFKASYHLSDFCLLELDDPIHPDANAYFAGWNKSSQPPTNQTVSIHHPNGNEKSIALNNDGTEIINYELGNFPDQNGNHLMIANWELGTTEYGSSGAPLFDQNQLVVGQLHGGLADCTNQEYDAFGWFFKSWEGGGTPITSLKYWLDPIGQSPTILPGQFEKDCGYHFIEILDHPKSLCGQDTLHYTFQLAPDFKLSTPLTLQNLPDQFNYRIEPKSAIGGAVIHLYIFPEGDIPNQLINFNLLASNNQINSQLALNFSYSPSISDPPILVNPIAPGLAPLLSWESPQLNNRWELQFKSEDHFVRDTVLLLNNYQTERLTPNTKYEWRVRSINECGPSEWSEWNIFITSAAECERYNSSLEAPIAIPDYEKGIFKDSIWINNNGLIRSVSIPNLSIRHSFIGDLTAWLESPQGTLIPLFDQLGSNGSGFGCPGEDLNVVLEDFANASYLDFNNTCALLPPAITGSFQPQENFSLLNGENPFGFWKLIIQDQATDDFGSVENWSLEICTESNTTSYSNRNPSEVSAILFPNPTKGELKIKDWPAHQPLRQVHIYATNGTLIQSIALEDNQQNITLHELKNGTYICHLQGQKIQVYRKIILMR